MDRPAPEASQPKPSSAALPEASASLAPAAEPPTEWHDVDNHEDTFNTNTPIALHHVADTHDMTASNAPDRVEDPTDLSQVYSSATSRKHKTGAPVHWVGRRSMSLFKRASTAHETSEQVWCVGQH